MTITNHFLDSRLFFGDYSIRNYRFGGLVLNWGD